MKTAMVSGVVLLLLALITSPVEAQGIYTPLSSPCRNLDTRVTNDPLQTNEIRIFSVDPLFSSLQGGTASCGVPPEADVVKITVHGMSIGLAGYFRVFDARIPGHLQTFSSLSINTASFSTVQIDVPIGGEREVAIYSPVTSAHAVVEVVGYYVN